MSTMADPTGPPQAEQAPQPAVETPAQGLPPTGLETQLATINKTYAAAQAQGVQPANVGDQPLTPPTGGMGSTSVQQLARTLAQQYGLAIGRGNLVDDRGNFLQTPDQLAAAGGDTMGTAAAKMNYISQAITRYQNEQQQGKATAAIQTGLGQVQSRGRGSLASMQSGFYQDLADLYSNQEYEAADFSYFIQKEQLDIAQDLMARQEHLARKMRKKSSRFGFIGGAAMGLAGVFTGNPMLAAGGFGQAMGSASGTGWFAILLSLSLGFGML